MTDRAPRDALARKHDTLALLAQSAIDVWVATAAADDRTGAAPYLVPLSLLWTGERAVIAVETGSRTARNIAATGSARLGVGPTRDVVLLDVQLEWSVAVTDTAAHELAESYAKQADWDPRSAGPGYVFLVLRPLRIQAWREVEDMPGRTLMRSGAWLV